MMNFWWILLKYYLCRQHIGRLSWKQLQLHVKKKLSWCWSYSIYFQHGLGNEEQSGAVEACWAHNPEVRRSKLRSAIGESFFQLK